MITVAVYGTFTEKDIRVKLIKDKDTKFRFQNILREAGYDCELFAITDDEMKEILKNG